MSGKPVSDHPLLRHRDGHHAHVTYEELFFDLAYVFADRLSHELLHNLTAFGVVETLILWFAGGHLAERSQLFVIGGHRESG